MVSVLNQKILVLFDLDVVALEKDHGIVSLDVGVHSGVIVTSVFGAVDATVLSLELLKSILNLLLPFKCFLLLLLLFLHQHLLFLPLLILLRLPLLFLLLLLLFALLLGG